MKFIFHIFFLLSFISCNSSHKSDKCTFNGEEIPCKEESPLSTGGADLYASLKTTVNVTTNYLEFLENAEDVSSGTVNGVSIECQVSIYSGQKLIYKLIGNKLTLIESGQQIVFNRTSGSNNSLNGTWINKTDDEVGYTDTKMIIEGQNITLFNHCYFN